MGTNPISLAGVFTAAELSIDRRNVCRLNVVNLLIFELCVVSLTIFDLCVIAPLDDEKSSRDVSDLLLAGVLKELKLLTLVDDMDDDRPDDWNVKRVGDIIFITELVKLLLCLAVLETCSRWLTLSLDGLS